MLTGKLKMVLQSATILVILAYVNYRQWLLDYGWDRWAAIFRDVCIWVTIAVTILSGILYIRRAVAIYREGMLTQVR